MNDSGERARRSMRERVRITANELVVYAGQHSILCVIGTTRVLAVAQSGVQILPGGMPTVAGVIRHRLIIELGEVCWALPRAKCSRDSRLVRGARSCRRPFEATFRDTSE